DRDQVAGVEPVGPRDPVHDHVVRRQAERGREAAIALRGRDASTRADVVLADPVELGRRHARPDVLADVRDGVGHERARGGHLLDLVLRLSHYQATAPACSTARWTSAKTSFSLRLPRMPTTLPRAR